MSVVHATSEAMDLDPFSTDMLAALPARDQRSVIGHAHHNIMSPLSSEQLDVITEHLGAVDRLLDVGSGKAALPRRMLRGGRLASALCIEHNPILAAHGRRRAELEGVRSGLEYHVGDARSWSSPTRFDVVVFLGSSQAVGGLQNALRFARTQLLPGGKLVIGEPVWAAEPHPEYLAFLGTDGSETPTSEELSSALIEDGFDVTSRHTSSREEWDSYERPYFEALQSFTTADGLTPFADQARAFASMQFQHGRASMGFETLVASRLCA